LALALACGAWLGPAAADDLTDIVVTATRTAQDSFRLPMSVDRLDSDAIQYGQSQVNLSESLEQIPGVSAENRQNYAQDLQISSRGFGARSSFGVRGVRLYSDGIPGTMPDGQGQFSQFDLSGADHIEVLRGPFSALYGNSSGGVIAVFTRDAPQGLELDGSLEYGSLNSQREYMMAGGGSDRVNWLVDASHFQTDDYRDHGGAQRNLFNSKVRFNLDEASTLTVVLNAIQTPYVGDPLGLTTAQLDSGNREQAGTGADQFNTRKSLSQEQLGLNYQRHLGSNDDLSVMTYGGHRATDQFLAIPLGTQAAPTSPGGMIDLARNYAGVDAHLTDRRKFWGTSLTTTAGFSYDAMDEHRYGYDNFVGQELGVQGALRRMEINRMHDLDEYLQTQWDLTSRLSATAGVRNSVIDISSNAELLTPGTLPLSGTRYSATNPVAGLSYLLRHDVSVYASFGKGFETPTLNELAYRSVSGNLPGMNFGLQPARSNDYEVGAKYRDAGVTVDTDVFYIRTSDELGVLQSSGGRSVYDNIGATERRGAELGATVPLPASFSLRLAYTYIKAVVDDAYAGCVGIPCATVMIPAGNVLPAIAQNQGYVGITWTYPALGFKAVAETVVRSRIYADDRNTAYAGGFWTESLRAGFEQQSHRWQTSEFVRIENLFNKAYVDSVILNDANGRYFEPDPGFGAYLMFEAKYLAP
jgi:iron complex outermembrane receptor protein